MNTVSIITSQNIELEYELGSLGDRIVGWILDVLVVVAYVILIVAIIGFGKMESFIDQNGWVMIVLMLPIVLYDLACEVLLNGQSVGKKVMGIKVISLAGEQPGFGQYLIRWIFRLIDVAFSSGIIAVVLVAATEKKQRLGDLLAGTVLVKTRPRTHFSDTLYQPEPETNYEVHYPEVINLTDRDIRLVREVLTTMHRTGNLELAWQAQYKIEQVLNVKSRHLDATDFLNAVLTDYNHLTSKL